MRARRGRRGTGTAGIELVVRQPWSGKTRTAATMRAARARFLRQGRGGRHGGASAPNGGARRGLQRRRFDGERELRLVHGGEQERRREREGAGLGLGFGERAASWRSYPPAWPRRAERARRRAGAAARDGAVATERRG